MITDKFKEALEKIEVSYGPLDKVNVGLVRDCEVYVGDGYVITTLILGRRDGSDGKVILDGMTIPLHRGEIIVYSHNRIGLMHMRVYNVRGRYCFSIVTAPRSGGKVIALTKQLKKSPGCSAAMSLTG